MADYNHVLHNHVLHNHRWWLTTSKIVGVETVQYRYMLLQKELDNSFFQNWQLGKVFFFFFYLIHDVQIVVLLEEVSRWVLEIFQKARQKGSQDAQVAPKMHLYIPGCIFLAQDAPLNWVYQFKGGGVSDVTWEGTGSIKFLILGRNGLFFSESGPAALCSIHLWIMWA